MDRSPHGTMKAYLTNILHVLKSTIPNRQIFIYLRMVEGIKANTNCILRHMLRFLILGIRFSIRKFSNNPSFTEFGVTS